MEKIDFATIKEDCFKTYLDEFEKNYQSLKSEKLVSKKKKKLTNDDLNRIEREAQKEAIKKSTIAKIKQYQNVEIATIWNFIYEAHIHRKSGIDDANVINKVVSADQSWKKSSGHAFEEMIKELGNIALFDTNLEILLQRDLSILLKAGELANEPRDLAWLREKCTKDVFDLYIIIKENDKKYCFGCIQSKTSIRDRVSRDREPSMEAMASFFWSVAITLDGDFLKLPKFIEMVNGESETYKEANGWHGMYVLSDKYTCGRIYPITIDFDLFKKHAIEASDAWTKQRQWFNNTWMAT